MIRIFLLSFLISFNTYNLSNAENTTADVCIFGATSTGVMSAVAARTFGKSVVLVEPGSRIGGLTSGGLGHTDVGKSAAIRGLALDFYRRVGSYYKKEKAVFDFEPKVALKVFQDYLREVNQSVIFQHQLLAVKKQANAIKSIELIEIKSKRKLTVEAKVFIDASYEGDLMAMSGVSYAVGRESNSQYNETLNGVQFGIKKGGHQFDDRTDPFKVKGDPKSGLVWGVTNSTLKPNGSGDKKVQAYNFRLCMTNNPKNRVEVTKPKNYDPSKYELLVRHLENNPKIKDIGSVFLFSKMPNNKTDFNNNGPFSSDMIGLNYDYPDGNWSVRDAIFEAHKNYTIGLLYFIGHNQRIPDSMRRKMLEFGWPKDEYIDSGHFTPQLYVRESRRMIGQYVMTEHNARLKTVVADGVANASYGMDSHNVQRIVVVKHGRTIVKNEGDVQVPVAGPFPVSYRSMLPKTNECENLLVPTCLSASHICYGSIRMEPVFMALGQAAGTAASMAIDNNIKVNDIDVKQLQKQIGFK